MKSRVLVPELMDDPSIDPNEFLDPKEFPDINKSSAAKMDFMRQVIFESGRNT